MKAVVMVCAAGVRVSEKQGRARGRERERGGERGAEQDWCGLSKEQVETPGGPLRAMLQGERRKAGYVLLFEENKKRKSVHDLPKYVVASTAPRAR
jgi:hypothetical protein